VRHRGGGEGPEPVRIALDHGGILVIHELGRGHRLVAVLAVRQLRRRREHLQVHPRSVHEPQPGVELFAIAGAHAALSAGVGFAEIDQQVEVVVGPVVGVHVDPHGPHSLVVIR
jgi:hypothetical protein